MGAPKGNKFAAKENPKKIKFGWRIGEDTWKKLEKIVEKTKLPASNVLELLVDKEFKRLEEK